MDSSSDGEYNTTDMLPRILVVEGTSGEKKKASLERQYHSDGLDRENFELKTLSEVTEKLHYTLVYWKIRDLLQEETAGSIATECRIITNAHVVKNRHICCIRYISATF